MTRMKCIIILLTINSIALLGQNWAEYEDEIPYDQDIRDLITLRTCTPSMHTTHNIFSPFLAHTNLRPFLLSIYNDSDLDIVLNKKNIGLYLPSDDELYASHDLPLMLGSLLSLTGFSGNIYVQKLAFVTSCALLARMFVSYFFLERRVLTDNNPITIKAHQEASVIIIVDDRDFFNMFTVSFNVKKLGYRIDFKIDTIQNGYTHTSPITFGGTHYA